MRADYLARSPAKLRTLLERFCNAPRIAKELAGGRRLGPALGHQLPLGSFAREVVFDRALLLGDAAGFINPFSGEGIEFALESGMYAAQAIAQAEQRGNFSAAGLHTYADLCALHFRRSFHFAHVMQRCFAWPRLVDFLIARARRSEAVRALLDNAFNGQKTRCSWSLLKGLTWGSP
jgi:flavin-dependent dehydrogenase